MSNDPQPILTPLEELSIDFYGDTILAFRVPCEEQTKVFVPVRPLCGLLGLAWSGQFERLKRDGVLSTELRFVRMTQPSSRGGDPVVLCLPFEYLSGWLFSISVGRVRPTLHASLHHYRRECYRVLAEHFSSQQFKDVPQTEVLPPVRPASVYVAYGGTYYKIGISTDVPKRLQALSRSMPFPAIAVCIIETDHASLLELQLHQLYKKSGKHINGEWFALSTNDIDALKAIPSPLAVDRFDEIVGLLGRTL